MSQRNTSTAVPDPLRSSQLPPLRVTLRELQRLGIAIIARYGRMARSISVEEADSDGWLLAARIGYFARVSSGLGIWPRGGITHLDYDFGDATALTLEVPLEFLIERCVALAVMPHADIGLGGNEGSTDRTLTEIGLQFGIGFFL